MQKEDKHSTYPDRHIRVSSPARLHLGFLDLSGETGRKFGSIGMAIDSHHTTIDIRTSHGDGINISARDDEQEQKIRQFVELFFQQLAPTIYPTSTAIEIDVLASIPEHAGLGSGTQLALTVGTALCKFYGIDASTQQIAEAMQRGKRSGIGIAAFDQGGFLIDGGLGPNSTIPPLLFHSVYPSQWRIVLVMQTSQQGVHGKNEKHAFKQLPSFPQHDSHFICHTALMQLLPALHEGNITLFGEAIAEIQQRIGDHFSPAQGGRYTSQKVAALLEYAGSLGHQGIAQSSWGPTGCIFVDNQLSAEQLVSELRNYIDKKFTETQDISILITTANTSGADIESETSHDKQ